MIRQEWENPSGRTVNPNSYSREETEALQKEYKRIIKFYKLMLILAIADNVLVFAIGFFAANDIMTYVEFFKAFIILAVTFMAYMKKDKIPTALAAVVWLGLPAIGLSTSINVVSTIRTVMWHFFNIPIGALPLIGIHFAGRYQELSKLPGFPYFTYRREDRFINNYAPPPRENSRQWVGDQVDEGSIVAETEIAMRESFLNKKKYFHFKKENPDVDIRSDLRREVDWIDKYFKWLSVWNIFLLAISISRLFWGSIISFGDSMATRHPGDETWVDYLNLDILETGNFEMIAAFVFAIAAVLAAYKYPAVSAATAALWIMIPRYGSWAAISESGTYVALYLVFNVTMILAYIFGIFLSVRWQNLARMPDFPCFNSHYETYEEALENAYNEPVKPNFERREHMVRVEGVSPEELETEAAMDFVSYEGAEEIPDYNSCVKNSAEQSAGEAFDGKMDLVDSLGLGEKPRKYSYVKKAKEDSEEVPEMNGIEYKKK